MFLKLVLPYDKLITIHLFAIYIIRLIPINPCNYIGQYCKCWELQNGVTQLLNHVVYGISVREIQKYSYHKTGNSD